MNSVFSEQILADKLSKLNSTQQCIETLSHWCIFHRSKAEVVVSTWKEQFHNSQMTQKIPLLYLANDILQNSKRKGDEFVTEFWKVLPEALKVVNSKGDENGKKAVSRLVKIWEERRVFGSKPQKLLDVMLGEESPPPLELGKKRSRTVKIVRRDSRSIRTKLSIGGQEEKIVSAFHLVHNEHATEESELNRCKSAVNCVRKLDHDVDIACTQAKDPKRKTLAKDLEEEETILEECIEKLKSAEANRVSLITHLGEALREQESELENIRTQMQFLNFNDRGQEKVAQAQIEEAINMRKRLTDENYVAPLSGAGKTKKTAADIAAEVADRLAASSSSQFIMSSVLSTFAAEEAKNAGLAKTNTVTNPYPANPASSAPNTNSKLEQPTPVLESNGYAAAKPAALPHQYQSMLVNQNTLQQVVSLGNQYQLLPNTTSQQYGQTALGVTAYGYGSLPPVPPGPPPPPPHIMGPMMPMAHAQLQMNQQQLIPPFAQQSAQLTPPQQQHMLLMQPPAGTQNFRPLQPPGMGYFSQSHQLH